MSQNASTHNFVSDPDLVAGFFEALIDGFKNRRLRVKLDEREITLKPAEILDMSFETIKRKGRQKLTLTISWPDPDQKGRASLLFPPAPESAGAGERRPLASEPAKSAPVKSSTSESSPAASAPSGSAGGEGSSLESGAGESGAQVAGPGGSDRS